VRAAIVALSLALGGEAFAEGPVLDPAFGRELDAFDTGEARTSRLKLRTMDALLAGGIVSTLAGAGLMASDRYDQGLRIAGGLSAGFGVVDLVLGAIAIPASVRAEHAFRADRPSRSTPRGLFEARRKAAADEHADATLFAINLGLDGGYVLAGLAAVTASQLGVDHPDRWLAGGLAVVVEGVFLAGIDLAGTTIAHRRHRAIVESLVPVLSVTPTPTGPKGSTGFAGRF
jgi:hypothetical protein